MPKSAIFAVPSAGKHDVGRLDVAVHDALGMRVVQRHRGLPQDAEHAFGVERRRLAQHLVQRRPIHVFHGDVGQVALLLHIVNGHDSRMREHARRSRLAEQPLAHAVDLLGLAIVPEMDRLDGHRTADIGIDGMVHHAHGAAAQLPDDLIAPDAIHSFLVIAHAQVLPYDENAPD